MLVQVHLSVPVGQHAGASSLELAKLNGMQQNYVITPVTHENDVKKKKKALVSAQVAH